MSFGGNVSPYGFGKLKILELTGNLLKCKNQALFNLVSESDLFTYILDNFFKYEWNNLLHL